MLSPDDRAATLAVVADVNRDRLIAQRDAIERMETKGTILLGFTVTAGQFVVTQDGMHDGWQIAALASYATALWFGVLVVAPYRHAYPADPTTLFNKYAGRPVGEVLNVLAATRATAFERNVNLAKRKTRAWWRTLGFLVLGVALSGVAVAV